MTFIKHDDEKPRLELITDKFMRIVLADSFTSYLDDEADVEFADVVLMLGAPLLNWPAIIKYAINNLPSVEHNNYSPEVRIYHALCEMGKVLGKGAEHYDAWNWCKCDDLNRYKGAALRHVFAHRIGDVTDDQWGFYHMSHFLCNVMFLQYLEK